MDTLQDRPDTRGIPIDWVGVTNLVYPATVEGPDGGPVSATATFDLLVSLAPESRGTHMSRLLDVLARHEGPVSPKTLRPFLEALRSRLECEAARARVEYTVFVPREAPSTGSRSVLACEVVLEATLGDEYDLVFAVEVPVMTLCPCSIESPSGAGHSQRGRVAVALRYQGRVTVGEVVDLVDRCSSAPVYPLLKRADERAVIEQAREHPVMIEDLVRGVAQILDSDVRVYWYRIEAENHESTHNHDAYACLERER